MANGLLAKGWTLPTRFVGRPPAVPSDQLALFPRRSVIEFACPPGKDLLCFVQADNNRQYYLKNDQGDMPVRANEWLSNRLAGLVGIATPRCDFIQTFDGDIAFGSEAVNGASKQAETIIYLENPTLNELGMNVTGLQAQLSAIHVLDLFLSNVDRHIGNFLVVGDDDERQLLALDYARAMFWKWPWSGFLDPSDTSSLAWNELRQRHGFDLAAAQAVADRLGIISINHIGGLLDQMPSHWLSETRRSELLDYCREGGWRTRIELLKAGLENGSIV